MPNYQMLCVFKNLPKPELVSSIKAAANCILENGGIIKSFENLGLRRLPHRLFGKNMLTYREGHYVFINFISGSQKVYEMKNALSRESDILRRILSNDEQTSATPECHCEKYGYFVTDIVDYTKPLTVWNRKITDPMYGKRLR
ncbi:unnamed protein product [Didymodactylos carnosus]|uniref:Small ribosomal subunit protein bS6m n=1 Tax=Didymodactylos carnosus TaxID=1234261 RepID=A0A814PF32_9BILA|nr:unnamed protein product [Didymodactylos carnosus]CAF3869455.1 unnamed protein product [Didymodactylos carnosus]